MAFEETYLNFPGLQEYDAKIKSFINNKSVNSITEQQITDLFKSNGNIVLSKNTVNISTGETDTITISDATGPVSVASSNSNIATVVLNNDIITISGISPGSISVIVNVAATDTHHAVSKTINVIIEQSIQVITNIPSQNGTLTYNGASQTPVWNDYNSEQLILGGITTGVNADTYTATFTPREGYQWSDNTITAKNSTWTIGRATITNTPSQKGTLTYNANEQSPTWNNYDNAKMTCSGTTSATNAGTYTASFTPTSNYKWSNGTTSAKSVTWTIDKTDGNIVLSKNSIELSDDKENDTVTFSENTGDVTVSSANMSIATASINGNVITIAKV